MASKPPVEEDDEPQSASSSLVSPNGQSEDDQQPQTEEQGEPKDQDDKGSVAVPEDFQRECASVVESATPQQLEFLRSMIMDREKTLRKAESKAGKAGVFDLEGMPS